MKDYIEKMVHNLNIQVLTENKCKTPINKAINEDGTSTPLTALERHDFLCALGMTGWFNQTARPGIALAQSRIAQHCANPTQDAMEAVLHLVSYLYHTRELCIRTNLKGETGQELLLLQEYTKDSADLGWSFHSDTDHARNKEAQNHRRSQNSRYCCHNGMVFVTDNHVPCLLIDAPITLHIEPVHHLTFHRIAQLLVREATQAR